MADYESYNSGNPFRYHSYALEDSDLLLIEKNDADTLARTISDCMSFKEKLVKGSYNARQKRILNNISDTAEERYENFI